MYLQFLGAAGEVTGSRHLLEVAGQRVLIDCGMFQGGHGVEERNHAPFGFVPGGLAAVILTHAHIDHSGLLPRLVREGFGGPVYATPATIELIDVMLKDSAHLMAADAARHARHARHGETGAVTPLYTLEDVERLLAQMVPLEYGIVRVAAPGIAFRFEDAGHILGSALVVFTLEEAGATRTLVMSGDLGQPGRPILRDPVRIDEADVVVLESTYGDRNHKPMSDTLAELVEVVGRTLQQKQGNVLIPAFAVGRTQEILYWLERLTLDGRLPPLEVFVDSPMANEVSAITARHFELFDEAAKHLRDTLRHPGSRRMHLHQVRSVTESMALNQVTRGAVIVASSGMCEGGRIGHHLIHQLPNERTTVLISGFQARGTVGRQLVEHAPEVRIYGQRVPVRAEIVTLGGFSAHADQAALLGWLKAFRRAPDALWLVHGEPVASEALAGRVRADLAWHSVGVARAAQRIDLHAPPPMAAS
jgi:metallo-beta-lactamase family protein